MAVRNLTSWINPSGTGYVITQGLLLFQDNLGNLICDNHLNNICTNVTYSIGKNITAWTLSGV
jgi:hypothetical protein